MTGPYEVIITPQAAADLNEIYAYIARESIAGANAVERELAAAIDSLQNMPQRIVVYRGSTRKDRVVRRMVVFPYLIFFRINDGKRKVDVVHVRHGARRPPGQFG